MAGARSRSSAIRPRAAMSPGSWGWSRKTCWAPRARSAPCTTAPPTGAFSRSSTSTSTSSGGGPSWTWGTRTCRTAARASGSSAYRSTRQRPAPRLRRTARRPPSASWCSATARWTRPSPVARCASASRVAGRCAPRVGATCASGTARTGGARTSRRRRPARSHARCSRARARAWSSVTCASRCSSGSTPTPGARTWTCRRPCASASGPPRAPGGIPRGGPAPAPRRGPSSAPSGRVASPCSRARRTGSTPGRGSTRVGSAPA